MQRFIILSHGRSGSTYLCHELDAHPRVRCYYEVIRPQLEERAPVDGKRYDGSKPASAFIYENIYGQQDPSIDAIGFKLFFFHARESVEERALWTRLAHDKDLKVILLYRRNLLAAHISELRATQSGAWNPALAREGDLTAKHNAPIFVDLMRARMYLNYVFAHICWVRTIFGRDRIVEVSYEGFLKDANAELRRVYQHLGVEPQDAINPFEATAAPINEATISNFGQLGVAFLPTIYASMIDGGVDDIPALGRSD